MISLSGPLVSAQWLLTQLASPDLVILNSSLHKASAKRIPGARVFELEGTFSDPSSELPHTLPSVGDFEREARALGINKESTIVCYDDAGVYCSPRVRWMFKAMGHRQAAVLDGGLAAWIDAAGQTVSSSKIEPHFDRGNFVARLDTSAFCGADEVARALSDKSAVIIDVRSLGRFKGTEMEPRPGLRAGHMPGARNLPFTTLLNNGRFRPREELADILNLVAPSNEKLIFSCGSGVTACIGAMAAELVGYTCASVYDGSWSEWGLPSDRPVTQEE